MATPTIEEYLETIYNMEIESPPARSGRVAEAMGVSAPTMTDTLRRMAQQGYVRVEKGAGITLTDQGRELAEALVRRHRLSERWLVDVLGLDWSRAHEEACKLEHAISQEVEDRLARNLKYPATCPHGNPIPGLGSTPADKAVPLDQAIPGREVMVARVAHAAEEDPTLLDYLQRNGIVPGARFKVEDKAVGAGLMILRGGENRVSLGIAAASLILVRRIS